MALWISEPDPKAFPDGIKQAEQALILARRKQAESDPDSTYPVTGLAISGGGIRSATFALGVLQALQSAGILRRFDYLSTVSGGGYVGSFLGSLFVDPTDRREGQPSSLAAKPAAATQIGWDRVDKALKPDSRELNWLRENGRYLAPNGAGDNWFAGSVILRNWVAVQVVLATFLFAVFLTTDLVRDLSYGVARMPGVKTLVGASGTAGMAGAIATFFTYDSSSWFWWSPWFLAPAMTLTFWAVPAGWAYWLVPAGRLSDWLLPVIEAALVLLAAAGLWAGVQPWRSAAADPIGARWIALSITGVVAFETLALRFAFGAATKVSAAERARNMLSGFLKAALIVTTAFASFAVIDSLGQTICAKAYENHLGAWFSVLASGVAAVGAFGNRLGKLLARDKSSTGKVKLPVSIIALVVALVLAAALLAGMSAVAHAVANFVTPSPRGDAGMPWLMFASATAIAWVAALLLGHAFTFINQSSQASFYAARLTRTYLGASNDDRLNDIGKGQSVTQVIPGDDIPFRAYRPEAKKGPLHIINTTLNETMDGKSQIEQQDRKGMAFALGPAGISVGVRHHAKWLTAATASEAARLERLAPETGYCVFQAGDGGKLVTPESVPLGRWVAISGAAFSTGLGWRTSLGLSLLCGMFNVRLGHWWWSGTEPNRREGKKGGGVLTWLTRRFSRMFPVQSHLFDEMLARFPGTARRHWYLTDGGHFENTACYEMIRRRVPFIVVIDNGEDESYTFDDLSQLVRKARLDFGAEIQFLSENELEQAGVAASIRKWTGSLKDISKWGRAGSELQGSKRCAALARITYDADKGREAQGSLLLVLKPTLMGDEPLDVIQYALATGVFPQQSTADQYFDEAQWESYRRLGQHIGRKVFAMPDETGAWWCPRSLDPTSLLHPRKQPVP